jgi:hypothetical protein
MPYKGNLILQQKNFEAIKFKHFNIFFLTEMFITRFLREEKYLIWHTFNLNTFV